jgi:hypothetical protein
VNSSLPDTLVNLRTLVGQARMLGASDDEILTRVVFALLRTRPHREVVARLVKLLDVLHEDDPKPRAVEPLEFDGPMVEVDDPTFENPAGVILIPSPNPRPVSPELRELLENAITESTYLDSTTWIDPQAMERILDAILPIIASVDANAHARGRAEAAS